MATRRPTRRTDFEETALVHLDALYGAARRLTRNPRDAEDLVQESVLRAYRFWDTFDRGSNCKAWLLRILTNTFFNEYQRRKRSREVLELAVAEQGATDGVLVHEASALQRSPESVLLERSVSDDVQRALDELPDDFRAAVVLCDVEGLSYKEIAEAMGTPVGTVMSRLFRGRKLLQASLAEFARAAGVLRDAPAAAAAATPAASGPSLAGAGDPAAAPDAIDLDRYRAARGRKPIP